LRRYTTGLVAVFIFMNLCDNLTVVGFGGSPGATYHYFNGLGARESGNNVHSWSAEDALVRALARAGRLTMLTAEAGRLLRTST
jgi:hypothetical protein